MGTATVAKTEVSHSERFQNMVMKEFGSNSVGESKLTDYEKSLISKAFIGIDRALQLAEENRIRKNKTNKDHKFDNDLPVVWHNINLQELAKDVMHFSRMGLDIMEKNHLHPIPYKNTKSGKYDMELMLGYNGIQYIAEKYAVETPLSVTTELVYSTDIFKPIKKNSNNKVESYEFEITNAFSRGEVIGGFGYIEYKDQHKNKLIIMSIADILKRKQKYAAAEFWGGTTKVWEDGKQVEVEKEGWKEEMYLKTLKREVYSAKHIPRDPKKIDDNYHFMLRQELKHAEMMAQAEIDENANAIDIETVTVTDKGETVTVNTQTGEVQQPQEEKKEHPVSEKTTTTGQGMMF
jgi:recombination protein RecT